MQEYDLDYVVDGVLCRGYCVEPDAHSDVKVPGIVMFPDFWGVNERQKKVAKKWAQLGCVVVVADMYGHQQTGTSFEHSAALMSSVVSDEQTYQKRRFAARQILEGHVRVDKQKVFCLGYCWGGAIALTLARETDGIAGVVSVHGLLATEKRVPPGKKMPRMLILNGAKDKMVTEKDISDFHQEMLNCQADFTFVSFGLATHAFTNQEAAGNDVVAYQSAADHWSDVLIKEFICLPANFS